VVWRGVGAGDLKKTKDMNTPLEAEFPHIMYLAFPSFQRTPYHWTTIIPSHDMDFFTVWEIKIGYYGDNF
jgi:hypothetical protein